MKQKHVVYIVSDVHKSLAFEWVVSRLKNHCKLTFILLNASHSSFENFLTRERVDVRRISYSGKKDAPLAFIKIFLYLLSKRPLIVHAHLFDATLVGLTAAWMARIKKRIYTRHNSTYHHLYHPNAVKYDRLANFLATRIISISQATDEVLMKMEGVSRAKIETIPHGFDFGDFMTPALGRVNAVREKWKIPTGSPIVGVISRHIEWKGLQYIIPAFIEFLKSSPNAILILANATGPYHETVLTLLKGTPRRNVILVPFEEDVIALYKSFDVFVHTPIDSTCEAFGQTYVEALAAGVPSIFSLSGIAREFIEHGRHAWVVDFKNSTEIISGLLNVLGNAELRKQLIENGRQAVTSRFDIDSMITRLQQVYDK